jgi:orotate phosphoribosyltransferase
MFLTTDVLDRFRESGALLDGHFRLSSGLHSGGYLQCALVLQHPRHAEPGRELAAALAADRVTAVLSPALGGLIIGHEVARALGVRAIFAERQDGVLTLRRGFQLSDADRVVVIEDVVTTGGSTARPWRWRARRARRSSPPARSSIAAADRRTSGCRSTRSSRSRCRPISLTSARCAGLDR